MATLPRAIEPTAPVVLLPSALGGARTMPPAACKPLAWPCSGGAGSNGGPVVQRGRSPLTISGVAPHRIVGAPPPSASTGLVAPRSCGRPSVSTSPTPVTIRPVQRCGSSSSLSDTVGASPRQFADVRSTMIRTISREKASSQASSHAQSPRDALPCYATAMQVQPLEKRAVVTLHSSGLSAKDADRNPNSASPNLPMFPDAISSKVTHVNCKDFSAPQEEAMQVRPPLQFSESSSIHSPRADADTPMVPTESTGVPTESRTFTDCSGTPTSHASPDAVDGGAAAVGRRFVAAAAAASQESRCRASIVRLESPRISAACRASPHHRAQVASEGFLRARNFSRGECPSPKSFVRDSISKPHVGTIGGFAEDPDSENRAWVPYARRKSGHDRCISPDGPSAQQPLPQQDSMEGCSPRKPNPSRKRFEDLYQDHEMRQRRWLERFEEKLKQEDNDVRQKVRTTCHQRDFDENSFLEWYKSQLGRYHDAEMARKHVQLTRLQRQADEELAECSFKPQANKAPPLSSRRHNNQTFTDSTALAPRELVFAQLVQIRQLEQLDEQYEEQKRVARYDAAKHLQDAVEQSRYKLLRFGETVEGKRYFKDRAQSYMELNYGMDESQAVLEAQEDLVRASESKLQAQAADVLQKRQRHELHSIQMERLKVARELIRLHRRCQHLHDTRAASSSELQDFDLGLVDRVTSESWYVEAREAATRILTETS